MTNVEFDGKFIVIEGSCPLCDWTHPHSHIRQYFQDAINDKKKLPSVLLDPKSSSVPFTSIPTGPPPGPRQLPQTTTVTKPNSVTNSPKKTTNSPKKPEPKFIETNVYRIRTVGHGLSLDRTVAGKRKKDAILEARKNHAKMFSADFETTQVAACHYIGQYKYKEPEYSSYGGHWMGWDDYF